LRPQARSCGFTRPFLPRPFPLPALTATPANHPTPAPALAAAGHLPAGCDRV